MNIPVPSADLLQEYTRTLMTKLDGNRDGQLSTAEFASFLARFGDPDPANTSATSPVNGRPAPYLAGFNDAKLANLGHTTVKYLFGRVAQQYSLSSVRDGASAETLLREMRPDLEAAGMTVLDVNRDKIQIRDDEGQTAWIDVIRGANSSDPAFQWHDTREE